MARPSKFNNTQILDRCLRLANEEGASTVSISAVARSLGAPSGSIYHRFASRDILVASLWLRCVERFQGGFLEALAEPDPLEAALAAARHTVRWSRANLDDARLLMVHRSSDLLVNGWPDEIADRNRAQRSRVTDAMVELTKRLGAEGDQTERVLFAVLHIPMGAVRPALAVGQAPSSQVEQFTIEAARSILAPLAPSRKQS